MYYPSRTPLQWVRRHWRVLAYVGSFLVVVAIQTGLYWWGMATLEGEPRTVLESLGIVTQSLTTTGYGQDAPWDSTLLTVLTIVMQFTGVAYLFIALPLFVVPWVKQAMTATDVPTAVEGLTDHVVLLGASSLFETLIDDLQVQNQSYVLLHDDREEASELFEAGKHVIYGRAGVPGVLERVNVEASLAIVIDAREGENVDTVLQLTGSYDDLDIICVINELEQAQYLRYAGATTILSPEHRLGEAIADKLLLPIRAELLDEFETEVSIAEVPVTEGSKLYGRPLNALDELRTLDATLIGAWVRGAFRSAFDDGVRVDEQTVLVAAGTEEELASFQSLAGTPTSGTGDTVVIVGFGIAGMTAAGVLDKHDRMTFVVAPEDGDGVDVVGDPTDPQTWQDVPLDRASAAIICLTNDDDAIKTTLVLARHHAELGLVVGARTVAHTANLYRAGAAYVLPIQRLVGRLVARELFDRDLIPLREAVELRRLRAPTLAGRHPHEPAIETHANVAVIGVDRNGDLIRDVGPDFELDENDDLVIVGPADALEEFAAAVDAD